ncbi:MAG: hypothetical protein KJ915_00585 [Candidatus Omnitrophica bacterium]|nr:hypothetical protein [Candidatus Omnitrophota bacterium]
MKVKILLVVSFLLVCNLSLSHSSYAEEITVKHEEVGDEINGKIEEINSDTDYILVKSYMNESVDAYEEDEFYVLKEAVIEKDGTVIKFNDLSQDDEITVRYRISSDGRKEAEHIWVRN